MSLPGYPGAAPAVDALSKAVGVSPEVQSRKTVNRSVTAYFWQTPWLSTYELGQADEVILALHTGGSRSVRTRTRDGWSQATSFPGHLHVIPPGTVTAFKPDGRLKFVSLHFARERLDALAAEGRSNSISVPFRFAYHDHFASSCIGALCDELRAPREFGSLFVDSLMDALWLHVLRPSPPGTSRPKRAESISRSVLARTREKIAVSLESGISLDELAAEAGLSRFHFARAFREASGEPPHSYLTRCRIERAKELLRHTEQSLAEVALAVGFSSQSHFSTTFRERVGQTPRSFRMCR